jgi:hypothetical protein
MIFAGCATQPAGEYAIDSQGHWRRLSQSEAAIHTFKSKVYNEARYEAEGKPPPDPNYTWRRYWTEVVPHWIGSQEFGTHEEVMAYIARERKARGLPALW